MSRAFGYIYTQVDRHDLMHTRNAQSPWQSLMPPLSLCLRDSIALYHGQSRPPSGRHSVKRLTSLNFRGLLSMICHEAGFGRGMLARPSCAFEATAAELLINSRHVPEYGVDVLSSIQCVAIARQYATSVLLCALLHCDPAGPKSSRRQKKSVGFAAGGLGSSCMPSRLGCRSAMGYWKSLRSGSRWSRIFEAVVECNARARSPAEFHKDAG